jgi:sugar lactone lactonase YvrE
MTSTPRRMAMLIALAMGLSLALAPAVAAHDSDHVSDLPARIDLPDGWRPEGIESHGKWLFAGSLANGAIWRANAKTGEGKILVPGETGKVAVGLHIDRWGRLWVAGGPTGEVRVYRASSGKLLQTYSFGTVPMLFFNDLDISRNRVVVTDSFNARVGVIPLREHGRLPDPSKAFFLPLKGDYQHQPGFNANGIAARGRWLVIVQSGTGFLFRLNPKTGDTKRIDTGGYLVTNGDGLDFRGRTLYVVRNQLNTVAVLRVGESLRHARLKGEIHRDLRILDVPTTATTTLGALWVVNARFNTPPGPDVDYWITRLPLTPDP